MSATAVPDSESHLPRKHPRLTRQYSSLLFSAASALLPALPFALITKDCNYVAAHALESVTIPADVEISRYYYKEHVEQITQELREALSLGAAAAEEWSKGLEARGKERTKAADNWERWASKHRFEPRSTVAATSHKEPSTSLVHRTASPFIHAPVPAGKHISVVSMATRNGRTFQSHHNSPVVQHLTTAAPASHYTQARPPTVPPQTFTPQPGSTQPSHQRNIHDANEAKASRKTDIERRCQQMSPPILPNVLRHMESFKAALQISQPMNDYAWSVLQPRLLAQLPAAQQAEAEHVARVTSLSTKPAERRHHDVNSKEAKEAMDREWEESQRPIRDKLAVIADDFIEQDWDHGKPITYENSPKFAADLLVYVRRKFYEAVAVTEPAHREPGDDATNAADNPTNLVLESMKWLYDTKIRPLTEPFRKDLYLCNGSPCDSSFKYYGFEGIIQHYGAKHTHAFSSGNIIVAWREAEWPEETPFHPDPVSVKHTYHTSNTSGQFFGGFSRAGTSTPHMQPHMPQASPGPHNFGGPYNGPFAPPQTPGPVMAGYEYAQQFGVPMDNYNYHPMGPPGYGIPLGSHSYMPSPALGNPTVAPPPTMPPPGSGAPDAKQDAIEDASHSTILFDKQVSTVIEKAQEIWKHTSGVKDMPNSLRTYVLLHRVSSKFYIEFNHEPTLDHFIDALANHEIPRALKNAPGLSCKACQLASSHESTSAYYVKPVERKTYTVSSLLSHFKSQHVVSQHYGTSQGLHAPIPDWKEDMIELPNKQFISGLIHAPGMDDEKLLMIAIVFPSLFPMPLPKIGVIDDHGLALPPLSGPKEPSGTSRDTLDKSRAASPAAALMDPPRPLKLDEEHETTRLAQITERASSMEKHRLSRDSPGGERKQRYHAEPRYYVGSPRSAVAKHVGTDNSAYQMPREHMDDGYDRPREYVEYAPSPRLIHSGPTYSEYSGRRTGFRGHEQVYGPPPEEVVYAHPREGSHGRDYGAYPRQIRYYEDEEPRPDYRYMREPQVRDDSPPRGQSAADRFLEEFAPSQNSSGESADNRAPPQPDTKPGVPAVGAGDGPRHTPPPPGAPPLDGLGTQHRQLAASHPRAPSTVSNGSRYEDHRLSGRHIPAPDSGGPSRRAGPYRRRDRPHEQRMPSRYYRLSVAKDDPYGRGSSMSRSQSKRYEAQRRQIDQQETPQPTTDRDYEPAYSRDHSVDQASPEDSFQQRQTPREYVSVQDRLHAYSPPRYRYDEPRGPQPMYIDEYGHPMHEYEFVRVRGEPRHPRGPYMPYPVTARYEPERYGYVPYERPPPQRYNSRGEHYHYEDRERALPKRPAPEVEPETYEPPPPEIKVESAPVPMPEGP